MCSAVLVSATLGLSSCVVSESVSSPRYYGTGYAYYTGYTGYAPPVGCYGLNYGIGCRHANWYGAGAYYRPGYATGGWDHNL